MNEAVNKSVEASNLSMPPIVQSPPQTAPSGLRAKIAQLDALVSSQNDDINNQKLEIENLLRGKTNLERFYEQELSRVNDSLTSEIRKANDEVMKFFNSQKSENARLQQQLALLKGEKTSLQQQTLALQRRVQELEEQIGSE